MNKKTIVSFIIVILVIVGFGLIWNQQNKMFKEQQALNKLTDAFTQFAQNIGMGGTNISDEKIFPAGTQPSLMHIGYPKSVEYKNGKYLLTLDLALWFSNEYKDDLEDPKADKALKEDGDTYGAPNGFYIRNNNHILKTLEVSQDATFYTTEAGSGMPQNPLNIVQFKSLLESESLNKDRVLVFDLENNVITKAYQHYVP